jgi:hypothetical protein
VYSLELHFNAPCISIIGNTHSIALLSNLFYERDGGSTRMPGRYNGSFTKSTAG